MQGLFTLTRIAMQGYHSSQAGLFFSWQHNDSTVALHTEGTSGMYMPGFYKGHILRQGEHASMHVLPEGDV